MMKPGPFLLDPANAKFARGESRKLPAGQHGCMVLFMIPFLLAAALLAGLTVERWIRFIRLNTDAAETWGEFVSREVDYSDDAPSYYVTFRFVVDDRIYTVGESVREETYDAVDDKDFLLVRYVLSDPSIATIEPDRLVALLILTGFCLVWDGIVVSFSFLQMRDYWRRWQLAQHGRRIPGEILHCSGQPDSDGDFTLHTGFRFRSPWTMAWIESTCSTIRDDLKGKPLPAPGTPLQVLYLDEKTYLAL